MIAVRRAGPDDLPRLAAWMLAFFEHLRDASGDPFFVGATLAGHAAAATFRHALAAGDLVLIAELDGAPVGYLLATLQAPHVRESPIERVGHISHCFVEAAVRRRGVTRQLVAAAEDWFRDQHVRYVELGYLTANRLATVAWPRLGYLPVRTVARKDLGR
jgi:GNAT superfamily N-acetyltransferase